MLLSFKSVLLNKIPVVGSDGSIFIETLMTRTADEPDALYGILAESIEYPEDRSFAIFNLRSEAKFSDGSKVTAEDVVFSHYVLLEKGIPSLKQVFSGIKKVEALTDYKVKFTFQVLSLVLTQKLVVVYPLYLFNQNILLVNMVRCKQRTDLPPRYFKRNKDTTRIRWYN
mgnify:CR=1 FL=1